MKNNTKKFTTLCALVIGATLLSGCAATTNNGMDGMSGMSGMDHMPGMSGNSSASASPESNPYGTFSEGEVMFMQMLYPLQAQAIDVAALAASHSQNTKLRAFAASVNGMNSVHTSNLAVYLSAAGSSPFGADAGAQLASMGVTGYASDAALAKLKSLNGAAFDTQFNKLFSANLKGQQELIAALTTDGNPNLSKCLLAVKQQAQQMSAELQKISGN
ncbi:MAG: DUF305 domain-containing protein [Micrococcales bacterium]